MKISVCIIVKDEDKKLDKCLKALADNGFGNNGELGEIVVTVTGSNDSTKEIARKYTDKIYDYEWHNDFAAAKNYCISKSSNEYVMIIDSDEYITSINNNDIQDFIKNHPYDIGQIKRANYILADGIQGIQNDLTERLFHKDYYEFSGCIHEQLVPKKPINASYIVTNISIDHDGYLLSEEELKKKSERNNKLLFAELEKNPNNPYLYFQIAQSYLLCRDARSALTYFEKGLSFDVDPSLEYVQMMVTGYGQCLMSTGQSEKALDLTGIYDDMSFCPDYVFMIGQIYMANNMIMQAYKEFLKCLSMSGARGDGVTSYFPLHNIGVINEMFGQVDTAKEFYKKAAKYGYKRSQDRLNELG